MRVVGHALRLALAIALVLCGVVWCASESLLLSSLLLLSLGAAKTQGVTAVAVDTLRVIHGLQGALQVDHLLVLYTDVHADLIRACHLQLLARGEHEVLAHHQAVRCAALHAVIYFT